MPKSTTSPSDSSSAGELTHPRILFLNRSYWPDAEATGQLLTELCEDLAGSLDVTVIAGQPNDNPSGEDYRRHGTEFHQGVQVRRVRHTRFAKQSLSGRMINYLTFLWGAFWAALWTKRPDIVVVETDPPLLCVIGWYLQRVRGAKLVVYLQDIHPDIAVALGKIRNGWLTRILRRLMFRTYRSADRIVVLSRDMRHRVIDSGVLPEKVVCIPNWIDTQQVRPVKLCNSFREQHGRNSKFIVMYSGNLGLCQRLEDLVAAAGHLRDRQDILFLLVGEGTLKRQLKIQAADLGLNNVRFLPYTPKSRLAESLSAADLHLVPLDPRVASCLMPSKLYGVLASGTPLVAVAPDHCELAELTRKHGIGVVARPGDPEALAGVLRKLADKPGDLRAAGRRARQLAEAEYGRPHVTARFASLLRELIGRDAPDVGVASRALPERANRPLPVTTE